MKHSPTIYAEAFWEAAKKSEPQLTANFLKVLRKNGAIAKLPDIIKRIEVLSYRKAGITKLEVISAREVRQELEPALKERFGKNTVIDFSVRPEIIGGVIIKINAETVIDASVKRRIDKLFSK